jgi:hypothetical protein
MVSRLRLMVTFCFSKFRLVLVNVASYRVVHVLHPLPVPWCLRAQQSEYMISPIIVHSTNSARQRSRTNFAIAKNNLSGLARPRTTQLMFGK